MCGSPGVCKRVMLRGGMFRCDRQTGEGEKQGEQLGRGKERVRLEREEEIWD